MTYFPTVLRRMLPQRISCFCFKGAEERASAQENTLTQATYEFYFENELPKRDNILKKQFDSAVKIIEN